MRGIYSFKCITPLCPFLALLCDQENNSLENEMQSRACSDRAVFSPICHLGESLQRGSSSVCQEHVECPYHCLLCKDLLWQVLVQFGGGLKVKGGTTGKAHRKDKDFTMPWSYKFFLHCPLYFLHFLYQYPKLH